MDPSYFPEEAGNCGRPPKQKRPESPPSSYPIPEPDPAQYSKSITLEHTFALPRKTRRGPKATKSTGKKPRPAKPKSATKKPTTPKPEDPEAPKQDRREYDRNRAQRPERKEYHRRHAQDSRDKAKASGLCVGCTSPSIPGQTRCEDSAERHRIDRRKNDTKRPPRQLGRKPWGFSMSI